MPNRTKHLSSSNIKRMGRADKGTRIETWDSQTRGFGIRINDTGRKSFFCRYLIAGGAREYLPLDVFDPDVKDEGPGSLAYARSEARQAIRQARRGESPQAARKAAREARAINAGATYRAAVAGYIERQKRHQRKSWPEVERILLREGAPWLDRPITSISRAEIKRRVLAIESRAPISANRTLSALRQMFRWAVDSEEIPLDVSPVEGIKPPGREVSRDRVLEHDEIRAVWEAFERVGWPLGPLFKLLLVTGQRLGEVSGMRHADVDIEAKRWTIPGSLTKSGRLQTVMLSPLAIDIIKALPVVDDEYVFASLSPRVEGSRPVVNFAGGKKRVDRLVGDDVAPWRLHDLRRTVASEMARLNVPRHILRHVLNHSAKRADGVLATYNRHEYAQERCDAFDAWARALSVIVGDGAPDNIVELSERR